MTVECEWRAKGVMEASNKISAKYIYKKHCHLAGQLFTVAVYLRSAMSAFKFNFSDSDNTEEESTLEPEQIKWVESEEISPSFQINNLDDIARHAKMYTNGDVGIGHVVASEVINNTKMSANGLQLAEQNHSDLIAGTYEGGLKIWECTNDLVSYITKYIDVKGWDKAKVMDLGCGAGILGILAFHNGSEVVFQDYNKEVIEYVTIPNVLLNIEDENRESEIERCKFYAGDWESFNNLLNEQYDYILTSETIYNPDNYIKIINIINKRLKQSGVAFVAAKTCYFGVGGGTREFETYVGKYKDLNVEVCWKSQSGIQREILKITKK